MYADMVRHKFVITILLLTSFFYVVVGVHDLTVALGCRTREKQKRDAPGLEDLALVGISFYGYRPSIDRDDYRPKKISRLVCAQERRRLFLSFKRPSCL